jgi:hypothetical protein
MADQSGFVRYLLMLATLILLGSSAQELRACAPPPEEPLDAVLNRGDSVHVGNVTGQIYTDYEAEVLNGEDPDLMPLWGERKVRVAISESLRGVPSSRVMEISVPCGSPSPEVLERVVVTIKADQAPYIWAGPNMESFFRARLGSPPRTVEQE